MTKPTIMGLDFSVVETRLIAYFGSEDNLNKAMERDTEKYPSATEWARLHLCDPNVTATGHKIDRHRERVESAMVISSKLMGARADIIIADDIEAKS